MVNKLKMDLWYNSKIPFNKKAITISTYLKRMQPYTSKKWENQSDPMKAYKNYLVEKLKGVQNDKCAYCGLSLGATSGREIEHIAPKSTYPEFMFERYNLVLACNMCNGPHNKWNKDTIITRNVTYKKCRFSIVHPYYDDPHEHYRFIENDDEIIILIQYKSKKGKASIEMMKLDSEEKSKARGEELLALKHKGLTPQQRQAVTNILNYKNYQGTN